MKDFEYYRTVEVPYPSRERYTSYKVIDTIDGGIVGENLNPSQLVELMKEKLTSDEAKKYLDKMVRATKDYVLIIHPNNSTPSVQFGGRHIILYSFDKDAYNAAQEERGARSGELLDEFRRDLAVENGNDPESKYHSIVYSKAWEDGHSSGLSEVANHYDTYDSFATDIINAAKEV